MAIAGWRNTVSGARALVTDGSRVALVGGYQLDRARVPVGRLEGGQLEIGWEGRLALPGGVELPPGARVVGRGPELHVISDDAWYRLSLESLPVVFGA